MSKIQIVNEHDEVIGHKNRTEIDYATDIFRSSCLWIENSKGEVLLAQRKWTKDKDPGKWGPAVAGTVDEGETYESNIAKEAEEEIGLTNVAYIPVTKIEHQPPRQFIMVFSAVVDKSIHDFTYQKSEVEQLSFVQKDRLRIDSADNPDTYVPSMAKLVNAMSQH